MNVEELADILGYTEDKNNWVDLDNPPFHPSTAHLYRQARNIGATHAYVFHTSPEDMQILQPRPAVFLAKVDTEVEASEIHRKLWLLGNAPFIILIFPSQVRVYTGFNYSENDKNWIEDSPLDLTSIAKVLSSFNAYEIDSGTIWGKYAKELDTANRVDLRLLSNLERLGNHLVKDDDNDTVLTNEVADTKVKKLQPEVAHALIGKYIYLKYLMDRKIVTDSWLVKREIRKEDVIGRTANREGLRRLTVALEARFNGGVFPLPFSGKDAPNDETISYVAGVFEGDTSERQLALDFKIYDFSYIPTELLSSIYEQFLRRVENVNKVGAYYTPEPVADYLVSELNYVKPLNLGMKVLDPCCGSGIFLVLAYRRLIEIAKSQSPDRALTPDELKDILMESIYGVERNPDACYVTEFSLLLTLLSEVMPPDLEKHENFKFPDLHNKRIFECDFFDTKSRFEISKVRFDWIIGNPPWVQLDPPPKNGEDKDLHSREWINENKSSTYVARHRVSDAFCCRVPEFLNEDGCIGLFIPATTLFNQNCKNFRVAFFSKVNVYRVSNLSNLVNILFSKAKHPASTIVYKRAQIDTDPPNIVHCGPFLVNQVSCRDTSNSNRATWSLTIQSDEIKLLSVDDVRSGRADVWKMALWGNRRDFIAYSRLKKMFTVTLRKLRAKNGWKMFEGVQLREGPSNIQICPLPVLPEYILLDNSKMERSQFRYAVPNHVLSPIPENRRFYRLRGGAAGLEVAHPPHILMKLHFAAYSERFFILPRPLIGFSGDSKDKDHLRAISILYSASVVRYVLFFESSYWGVSRNTLGKHDIDQLAVPHLTESQIAQLADLHRRISHEEQQHGSHDNLNFHVQLENTEGLTASAEFHKKIQPYLDNKVEEILGIPMTIRTIVKDFLAVKCQFVQGKWRVPAATSSPTNKELVAYGITLAIELDTFIESESKKHQISLIRQNNSILCQIELMLSSVPLKPIILQNSDENIETIWKLLRQRRSQWVYVQRSLIIFQHESISMLKSSRLVDWTETQAMLDSTDLIGEIISQGMKVK